jgi:hypothetical protein
MRSSLGSQSLFETNLALDGSIKPTVLTQDDSIADNGVIDMAPNSVIVGGLDHNGNPKMVPFRDGVRVDWVAAEIDRLESRIDAFKIDNSLLINGLSDWFCCLTNNGVNSILFS